MRGISILFLGGNFEGVNDFYKSVYGIRRCGLPHFLGFISRESIIDRIQKR